MERPGFWAAYYLCQSMEDDDLVTEVWDVDRGVVRRIQELLSAPASWPVFEVDLASGAKLAVVYRNFQDDPGVDYLLVPNTDDDCIQLASSEGDGPGICWRELTTVSGRFPDPGQRARTMLLLTPMLGDVEAQTPEAVGNIVAALRAAGATGDAEAFADQIVSENLDWDPANWRTTSDGLTVCDADFSPRNPEGVNALEPADLRTVSRLLGG